MKIELTKKEILHLLNVLGNSSTDNGTMISLFAPGDVKSIEQYFIAENKLRAAIGKPQFKFHKDEYIFD